MLSFESITEQVNAAASELPEIYQSRLKFELQEIKKQGAEGYWAGLVNDQAKYSSNPAKLVLPWLLNMVEEDPIAATEDQSDITTTSKYADIIAYHKKHSKYPVGIKLDTDKPDIDIDFLPESKPLIENYAVQKYSSDSTDDFGKVCGVSSWTTYKFKSALADVAKAHRGMDDWPQSFDVERLTKEFPNDVDDMKEGGFGFCRGSIIDPVTKSKTACKNTFKESKCPKCGGTDTETPTLGKLIEEIKPLADLNAKYPKLVDIAARLVGKIQGQGKHAGAVIISNEQLYGNLPLYKRGEGDWMSLWTEGRITQLSKYGFIKWDILGLLNLQYIYECCKAIQRNHGISFGENLLELFDTDPTDDRLGWYIKPTGERVKILLNDPGAFNVINTVRTDGIFQFDTPVAQNILKQCNSLSEGNAVRTINDLLSINALGHPGPMAMIPDFIKNREDTERSWEKNVTPEFMQVIGDTYNCIVFQEQLAALWQNIAHFTSVQAQESRKAVAKKWIDKLRPIEEMWMIGAGKSIGQEDAAEWWSKMVTFGRYAFNKSHALAYCLVAYTCCWLKNYFPLEFWEAVFSGSSHENRVRYISSARKDGIIIKELSANELSENFLAVSDVRINHDDEYSGYIVPGMVGIKGFDKKKAKSIGEIAKTNKVYENINEFIEIHGKSKVSMESLINLGAFDEFYHNRKALWMWYQYNHCSGAEVKKLKEEVRQAYYKLTNRTEESIMVEREDQIQQYKMLNPKKKKIPVKITSWVPPIDTKSVDLFNDLYADYTYNEILELEKEFLGLTIHSPMWSFEYVDDYSIANIGFSDTLDCVLISATRKMTKATDKQESKPFIMMNVTDGVETANIYIWSDNIKFMDTAILKPGVGLRLPISYNENRNQTSLAKQSSVMLLKRRPAQSWRDVVDGVGV